MNGKERVLRTFKSLDTDRVPWVPFVGCHAAALIGKSANDFLHSEELIVKGVQTAIDRYSPDGIPVMFDLQVEAEALGCELRWADDNPPSVTGHPLAEGRKLEDLIVPSSGIGRMDIITSATRKLRKANHDIALYGLITGPFTLALHLMGTDIFMRMFDEPSGVKELLAFCRDVCIAMSDQYMEAGCDIVAVVDPMTSQIGPDQFLEFITPVITPVFENIRKAGRMSSFFVCGHAQQNIEAMCDCRPDNVSIDENIPLQYVRDVCLERKVSFGGNLQLTSVLLLGKPIDAQKNAIACMEIGGNTGFILAPGCDLPYATPPENIEAVKVVVEDEYQREIVKQLAQEQPDEDRLDMREYGQADKIIVDIITLDSEACAPCQYMVDAVQKVAPEFEDIVIWREHKIKYRESLVFMTSLMVRNVPTICIDGQITFVSRIPPRDELVAAIQRRINEKFRMKIKRRKASLYILGEETEESRELKHRIDKATAELGLDIHVQNITDRNTIFSYGVALSQTPAVVMARYQLKSVKTVPETAVIKEWLKDIM